LIVETRNTNLFPQLLKCKPEKIITQTTQTKHQLWISKQWITSFPENLNTIVKTNWTKAENVTEKKRWSSPCHWKQKMIKKTKDDQSIQKLRMLLKTKDDQMSSRIKFLQIQALWKHSKRVMNNL